ncbi:fibronectin type III domain-containing protein [Subtercola boreus]|uniref:fibronectin type III domain-containing protein n=1 Tax=Subtercola boreus TaxID=120213 RepID=UPI0011C076D5|nr:hypothetical protein [Subtercola boreus]
MRKSLARTLSICGAILALGLTFSSATAATAASTPKPPPVLTEVHADGNPNGVVVSWKGPVAGQTAVKSYQVVANPGGQVCDLEYYYETYQCFYFYATSTASGIWSLTRGVAYTFTITTTTTNGATAQTGPVNLVLPALAPMGYMGSARITGTPEVRNALTANNVVWNTTHIDLTFTYQWYRNGSIISGATAIRYKSVAADAGRKINVSITAHQPGYLDTRIFSPSVTIPKI